MLETTCLEIHIQNYAYKKQQRAKADLQKQTIKICNKKKPENQVRSESIFNSIKYIQQMESKHTTTGSISQPILDTINNNNNPGQLCVCHNSNHLNYHNNNLNCHICYPRLIA